MGKNERKEYLSRAQSVVFVAGDVKISSKIFSSKNVGVKSLRLIVKPEGDPVQGSNINRIEAQLRMLSLLHCVLKVITFMSKPT